MMMRINYYWWLIDYYFCLREKGRGEGRKGEGYGGEFLNTIFQFS